MHNTRLLVSVLLPISNLIFAQSVYYEDVSYNLPPDIAGACMDAAAGDVDGDGDLDLVLAMEFQRNRLLLNDGGGRFADATDFLPDTVHDSEDVAFVDVNYDGYADLFFVSEDDRTDELYLNDGTGRFTDASDRLTVSQVTNAHAVLDLNRDGFMDLLFGNIGPDVILLNNGDGTFFDATAIFWPQSMDSQTQDLELFDLDLDGDLDLAVGNEGQNQLYLNDKGVLIEITDSSLPRREDETREIRAVDIDGDGDLDLAVANVAFVTQGTAADYLLLNDGTGVFTVSTAPFPENARNNFTIQTVDIDRDGDADLLLPSTAFPSFEQTLYMMAAGPEGVRHLYRLGPFGVNDQDDDGDQDIFTRINGQTITFTNENGNFSLLSDPDISLVPVVTDKLDFNDDGTNELAIWDPILQLQENSDAIFSQNNLAFYDVDDNGSIEVMGVTQRSMSSVGDYLLLLNDGTGAFIQADADVYFPASADGNGFDIEVADFDNDGLPDMFFCNRASIVESPEATGGMPRLLRGIIP